MLAIDQAGNKLLEFIEVNEDTAAGFSPITVCLLVVKMGKDYLMGFNHWRKCWEIFGGCPEEGETMRQLAQRYAVKMKKIYQYNHMRPGSQPEPGTILLLRKPR